MRSLHVSRMSWPRVQLYIDLAFEIQLAHRRQPNHILPVGEEIDEIGVRQHVTPFLCLILCRVNFIHNRHLESGRIILITQVFEYPVIHALLPSGGLSDCHAWRATYTSFVSGSFGEDGSVGSYSESM